MGQLKQQVYEVSRDRLFSFITECEDEELAEGLWSFFVAKVGYKEQTILIEKFDRTVAFLLKEEIAWVV